MRSKSQRLWVKQEKRIVRLLYKKGLMKDFKLDELYFAAYTRGRTFKSRDKKYRHTEYLPEIHYAVSDYWGEVDEHSVVDTISNGLYWENVIDKEIDTHHTIYPLSSFKYKSRRWFIKYLRKLPTVVSDNKVKNILKNSYC